MRRFFFARNIDYFDILESCLLKPITKCVLGEAHPAIAIEVFGLRKIMFEKVNDDDLPDNLYKVEGGLEHHAIIEYTPAKD